MYIVRDDVPYSCFQCPHRGKCDVWESLLNLPPEVADNVIDNLEYFKPEMNYHCKIYRVPKWLENLYTKWWRGECRHLCLFCKYRKECDL